MTKQDTLTKLKEDLKRVYSRMTDDIPLGNYEELYIELCDLEDKIDVIENPPPEHTCECCGVEVFEQVVHKAQLGYNGTERYCYMCDECNEEYI